MMDSLFVVDETLCRKDGICAKVCPVRIIKARPGELPVMDEGMAKRCLACGQCMAFCPTEACVAPGLRGDDRRLLRPERIPSPDQVEELVFSRRTVRNFKEKAVPKETLVRILDAVRFAPTGHNRQSYRWIVLEDREKTVAFLEKMIDWLRGLPQTDPDLAKITHAEGVTRAWDKGVDILTRNAPQIAITVGPDKEFDYIDGLVGLTYFEVLAHAHGLGCCWSGYMTRAFTHPAAKAVRDHLGVEPGDRAYSAQIVGYPKYRTISRPPRKPLRLTWK